MTLFKRGKVWWAYVTIDGIRHHKSTNTGNRREALTIGQEFEIELYKQLTQPGQRLQPEMKFSKLVSHFIAEGLAKAYALDRIKHLLPFFGDLKIGEINKSVVRRYRQERHAASTISVATVNRDMSVVRRILYFAQEDGYIATNPLARMRMERERRTKRPVLSYREEQEVMKFASPHLKPIILCALDTGMRRGEILSQDWRDVDFDNELLNVSHSKTPEGEMREIPLTRRLLAVLYPMRRSRGPVFTFDGEAIKLTKSAWAGALRRSKIRHFRFHDLRHTANTRLMLAGVMQEVRRELIGHSSRHSRDVNDRYTQIELPEKRDAIRKLDIWLQDQKTQLASQSNAPVEHAGA
jgi:integrase